MDIKTNISYGHLALIKTFFDANELNLSISERICSSNAATFIDLSFIDGSDTDYKIMLMSIKHLGFENMLCDYLKRCGIPVEMISIGRSAVKRDMKQLDKDYENFRKQVNYYGQR